MAKKIFLIKEKYMITMERSAVGTFKEDLKRKDACLVIPHPES
jgi:hypothetical protein